MSRVALKRLAWAGPIALFLLHNDFWLWDDGRLALGLPIGLLYHAGYCVAAWLAMAMLVRHAWPDHLEVESPAPPLPGGDRRRPDRGGR